MLDSGQNINKSSVRSQLIVLIDIMSEKMRVKLLGFLQEKLDRISKENKNREKRGDARRQCLIPVDYSIQGRPFKNYILDISAYGAFIETDETFSTGDDILLNFTLPNHQIPFNLRGEIVWYGSHGFGVKFKESSHLKMAFIRSFAEQAEEIYEINS
jgi:Tfp pilus assembly protein PilZ